MKKHTIIIFFLSLVFSSKHTYSQISDIDGNSYSIKKIGDYYWTLSNLNVSHYNNGDTILQVKDPVEWSNLTTGAWCWYENDSTTYADKYGKLYNWYALTDPRGIAPAGWHIPTFDEWDNLIQSQGGELIAGGKMKAISNLWSIFGNIGGTNLSGFTGLPGGMRTPTGSFYAQSYYGYWWSRTGLSDEIAKLIGLLDYNEIVLVDSTYKQAGLYVRCVKDIKGAYGNLFNDLNEDCLNDTLEQSVADIPLIIKPIEKNITSNKRGKWYSDSLPIGNYSIVIDTSLCDWAPTCSYQYDFTITNPDSLIEVAPIPIIHKIACVDPEVSVYAPFLRRCFSEQKIYISVKNKPNAKRILENSKLLIKLDPLLIVDSSSIPINAIGGNEFEISLDPIYPANEKTFIFFCTLSCNAILNQSVCIEAELSQYITCFPDTVPKNPPGFNCNSPWDKSSLSVSSYCNQDSVYFVITNNGKLLEGDMTCYSQVRIFRDNDLFRIDTIKLLGQQSYTYSFLGQGKTWLIQVDQHPLHPGKSFPTSFVEGCGIISGNIISPNVSNNFPLDDLEAIKDIYCGAVTGAYDPNDKQGYPLGKGLSNEILPNQQLQYIIRFQNTGNDTAFNVVIKDVIDDKLEINSISPGVSSHKYNFKIVDRTAEWHFPNIMLPDSNINEPGSNGFVTFTINQLPNLPGASQITNSAGIYFDFNDPIITNTTLHTINPFTYQPNNVLSNKYYFNVNKYINYNKLFFELKDNINVISYTIERSDDGYTWYKLNTITNNFQPSFEYLDYSPNLKINYYRIRINLNNNTSLYSEIRVIKNNNAVNTLKIFPNPTQGNFILEDSHLMKGEVEISIYRSDMVLLLKETHIIYKEGKNEFLFNLKKDEKFMPGIYFVELRQNNKIHTLKFLVI